MITQRNPKGDNWLNFEFFLATELGKTVSELRSQLTDEELIFFSGYYELKYDREKKEADAIKRKSRYS